MYSTITVIMCNFLVLVRNVKAGNRDVTGDGTVGYMESLTTMCHVDEVCQSLTAKFRQARYHTFRGPSPINKPWVQVTAGKTGNVIGWQGVVDMEVQK